MTALLTDNLPLLAGAPNGIKKLRELILELAVRGKLVPQDPNDEPASELLERIAEEKARLVAEGKIKKQKPLAEIGEEERPFDVPTNWEWVRLGEIAEIIRGVTYTKSDASDAPLPEHAPLLRGNNINRTLNFDRPVYVPQKLISELQYIKAGDIVIAMSSGSADLVGKAAQATASFDGAFGAFCGVVRSRTSDLFQFFGFFFQTPLYRSRAAGHGKGIGINNLQKSALETLEIPIPPLAEQHRIVAKVDELMALCDRLEAQQADAESAHVQLVQALLGSLTQAADAEDFAASWQRLAEHFHTLFITEPSINALKQTLLQLAVMGKLVPQDPNDEPADELLEKIASEIAQLYSEGKIRKPKSIDVVSTEDAAFEAPQGWKWLRLSQITRQLGDGLHGTPIYSKDGEYYFVNGNNLKEGKIAIKPETKTVSEAEYIKHKKPLDGQSILVSINGTIGNVAFYNSEKIVLGKSACYLNLASGVSKDFVRLLIEGPGFMKYALKSATGTTIKNLGLKAMNDYPIALPPLAEQHRIVAKVDQLTAICDQLKTRLTQARRLNEQLATALVEQAVA